MIRNPLDREPPSRFNDVTIQRFTRLHVRFGLWQADHFLTVLPMASLLENLDPFEAFQHIAFSGNGTCSF